MEQLTPHEYRELIKSQIIRSFSNVSDLIEKGGAKMPIGTTHNGYKKVAQGKWQKVSNQGMTKKEHFNKNVEHNKAHIDHPNSTIAQWHKNEATKHYGLKNSLDDKDYSDDEVLGKKSEGDSDKISQNQLTTLKVGQTFTIGEDMKLSSSRASGSYYNLNSSKYGDIKLTVEKINNKTIQCTVSSEDYSKLPQSAFNYNTALQADRIIIKL